MRYCYEHHAGVCVANLTECTSLGGAMTEGVGCGGPSGSGCACGRRRPTRASPVRCHAARARAGCQRALAPTVAPTRAPRIVSKKTTGAAVPVVSLAVVAVLLLLLAYCAAVATIETCRRRKKRRASAAYHPDAYSSPEEIATQIEKLGPKATPVADRVRELRIDSAFLEALDSTSAAETLVDLGCEERLFRRRIAFELQIEI